MNWQRPRKHLGQNFLHDQQVIERIIQQINLQPDDHVVEIGPGRGALTHHLVKHRLTLDLVELDNELALHHQENFSKHPSITCHHADALKFSLATLSKKPQSLRIVGNLPYNISTPLLFHWFSQITLIQDMHFMLQKEVVQRLAAAPGNKNYGRLSVMAQYFCEVTCLFHVSPGAFTPPPKVDSSIVRLVPRTPTSIADDLSELTDVVRMGFSQRRKMLGGLLRSKITGDQLTELGIDPKQRAECLSVDDFVRISNAIHSRKNSKT